MRIPKVGEMVWVSLANSVHGFLYDFVVTHCRVEIVNEIIVTKSKGDGYTTFECEVQDYANYEYHSLNCYEVFFNREDAVKDAKRKLEHYIAVEESDLKKHRAQLENFDEYCDTED